MKLKKLGKWIIIGIALFIIIAIFSLLNSTKSQTNNISKKENIGILVGENIEGYNKDEIIQIINVVKKIEELDHKFSNFLLTYDEYISELDKLDTFFADWIDDDSHYDRRYVPIIDMKKLNKDEINEIRNTTDTSDEVKVEMSKVYSDEKNIYVFTKSTIKNDDSDDVLVPDNIITRRYDIRNIDGTLKIITINMGIYDENTEENQIQFNKFNNQSVDYKYTFNPLT